VEALERGVPVIAVNGVMIDAANFEILDKIRGEEALADAFAVNDEVNFVWSWKSCVFRGFADRQCEGRGCVNAPLRAGWPWIDGCFNGYSDGGMAA
jgi:hypothetical protein